MTMWVYSEQFEDEFLCDLCIYNDEKNCCTAEDCFGGDHFDNQLRLEVENDKT